MDNLQVCCPWNMFQAARLTVHSLAYGVISNTDFKLTYVRICRLRQYEWPDAEITREEFLTLLGESDETDEFDAIDLVAPLLEYAEFVEEELIALNKKIDKHAGSSRAVDLKKLRDTFLQTGLVRHTNIVWEMLESAKPIAGCDIFADEEIDEMSHSFTQMGKSSTHDHTV